MNKAVLKAAVALVLAAALGGAATSTPHDVITYRLTPVTSGAALDHLAVEIRLRGDADGATDVRFTPQWGGAREFWRQVEGLSAAGATSTEAAGEGAWRFRHPGGAPLVIRYRVRSAVAEEPGSGEAMYRAIVRPSWFSLPGEAGFLDIYGRESARVRFEWGAAPPGWTLASDLDHGAQGRPLRTRDVIASISMGGRDVGLHQRTLKQGSLRVAARGRFSFTPEAFADAAAQVIDAQREFWGDVREPFFVTLFSIPAPRGGVSTGGTGRSDAFASFASENADLHRVRWLIAHEHMHSWIPRRVGGLPATDEALAYWFSEGFTDFYTTRTLLRSGLWTPEQYVEELNDVLAAYAESPVRTAPNGRIGEDYWKDREVRQLPYQRGMLLASVWDHRLRVVSGGRRDMDDVVLTMRDRAMARRGGPSADQLFAAVYREISGIDLAPEIARHADRGEPVLLPEGIFDDCARVETTTRPRYDRGFLRAEAGETIRGVDPAGPAYAAGMRDGMVLIRREAGEVGNSTIEIAFRVRDGTAEKVFRYLPAGPEPVTWQQVRLARDLTGEARTACARRMSGA